jgi:hypothetical protein
VRQAFETHGKIRHGWICCFHERDEREGGKVCKPTLCGDIHSGKSNRLVGRKGWGTQGMVRDEREGGKVCKPTLCGDIHSGQGIVRDEREGGKFVNPPFAATVIRVSQTDWWPQRMGRPRCGWGEKPIERVGMRCSRKLQTLLEIAAQ